MVEEKPPAGLEGLESSQVIEREKIADHFIKSAEFLSPASSAG